MDTNVAMIPVTTLPKKLSATDYTLLQMLVVQCLLEVWELSTCLVLHHKLPGKGSRKWCLLGVHPPHTPVIQQGVKGTAFCYASLQMAV